MNWLGSYASPRKLHSVTPSRYASNKTKSAYWQNWFQHLDKNRTNSVEGPTNLSKAKEILNGIIRHFILNSYSWPMDRGQGWIMPSKPEQFPSRKNSIHFFPRIYQDRHFASKKSNLWKLSLSQSLDLYKLFFRIHSPLYYIPKKKISFL